MKKKILFLIFFTYPVFFLACSTKNTKIEDLNLKNIVNSWTSSGKLFSSFETIFLVDALYKSDQVRKTFIDEYAKVHNLTDNEKDDLKRKDDEKHKNKIKFIISMHTGNPSWNDLHKKDSIWMLTLRNKNGAKLNPTKITRLKFRQIKLKEFYPFITQWKTHYEVEFEKTTFAEESLTLTVSSMIGKVELSYK